MKETTYTIHVHVSSIFVRQRAITQTKTLTLIRTVHSTLMSGKVSVFYLPFRYLSCPRVTLDAPTVPHVVRAASPQPPAIVLRCLTDAHTHIAHPCVPQPPLVVFGLIMTSYFVVTSGFIYDIIRQVRRASPHEFVCGRRDSGDAPNQLFNNNKKQADCV